MEIPSDFVKKSTWNKVLNYIALSDELPPYLLVDKDVMKEKVDVIGKNIKNSRVFYAVKANPDIEVLRFLNSLGTGFEIASEGELQILASLGVEPDRIITSNPVKTFKFLEYAADYGVNYFAYDSVVEVEKLAKYAPKSNVYVRLSVPNEGSEWPLSKKFGVELDTASELLVYAKEKGLNPVGITFHVGSQCNNVYNWNTAVDKARDLWDSAEQNGIRLKMLNIGGGYPIRYTKNVVDIETIEKKVNKAIYQKFPNDIDIFIEPGRAVVGDAGIFVCTVIGKAVRGDENWLYIDVGVFNGLMESVGGIKYTYIVGSRNEPKTWTISGPSCDSFDVIDKEVELPEPEIGNRILILSSGAYTISYASEFNGFSIPKTILI
ncbi:ornithine decarboxylase [Dissulfurispira thermophila]|uniref:ornithine decarboxylase n=2 Tax=root TaxID=1 RepID=A0A7G1H3A1_9BACT|nr:type III PLP-dependent enzyme [Dissulfurispira thermophila]BCB97188.1 ornithine decarboxylase [Dissulfurispira thermophila]